jgi:phage-related protein
MSSVREDILLRVHMDDNDTKRGVESIKGRFNTLKAGVGVAMTAMGAQMLQFSKTCVESAINAESGWNSYTTALERVGGVAGRNIGEIKSEVTGLASTLGRSTADVRQAETDFMNYGVSAQTAMRGASAVSAIAAAKNMDYASSEQVVMSALKGRGMQLKSLGIDISNYKDATTGAIDTTRLFNDIMAKYGSSQDKYSKSAQANQQRLTNSMNSFKTAVGTALVPILEAVTPLIVQLSNALASSPELSKVVAYIMLIGGGLNVIEGPLRTINALFGTGLPTIVSGLNKMGSVLTGVGSRISSVYGDTRALYDAWKERPDLFDESIFAKLSRLKQSLMDLPARIRGVASSLASMVKSNILSGLNSLKTSLSSVGASAVQVGQRLRSMLSSAGSTALTTLKTSLDSLKTTLATVGSKALEAGRALLTLGKNALIAGLNALKSAAMWVVEKVQLVAATVATYAMTVKQTALNIVMSLNPITIIVIALIALVAILVVAYYKVDWFREGINQLGQYLLQLVQTVYTVFTSIPTIIGSMVANAISSAVRVGQGIYNGIMNFINSIVSGITNVFNQIVSTITGFAQYIYDSALKIGQNIWNGIIDGLGALGSWFNSLFGGGAGGIEAGLTYAGGTDAGLTYTGNQTVKHVHTLQTGNPSVNKTTNNSNRTIVLQEGALTVDARNLTVQEGKQLITSVFESIGSAV